MRMLHLTPLALLGLTPSAFAVPDACDEFGPLAVTQPISDAETQIEGTVRYQNLGYSVANIGDFNADGEEDFALGAPGDNAGGARAGAVYLFFGPMADEGTLSPLDADVILVGPGAGAQAGWSVDGAGDLDGDGRDDLIIGGYPTKGSYATTGVAWVIRGAASPPATANLLTQATATITGPGGDFGSVVAGIGDTDGDGTPEFAVGAPAAPGVGGAVTAGGVFVFNGLRTGATTHASADYGFLGAQATGRLGSFIDNVGDVDGDGFDDLAFGAPTEPIPGGLHIRAGAVHIISANSYGPGVHDITAVRSAVLRGQFTDRAGTSFTAAGDVNDDGFGDLWVGAPQFGAGKRGAVYLVHGGSSMVGENFIVDVESYRVRGVDDFDLLGTGMAGNVDFDADGELDVLVGAERADGPLQAETGAAWALLGPFEEDGELILRRENGALYGQREDAFTGSDVAVFNDINGDGFADALVPSWRGDSITINRTGEVGLFLGGADLLDERAWYRDTDGDTWGDAGNTVTACEAPSGYVERDGDCNDGSTAYHPFVLEPDCGSPADFNCDGSIGHVDVDGDGVEACLGDCNDTLSNVHTGASEVCFDELDNDCNGGVDDGLAIDATTWYPDLDADGFGNRLLGIRACEEPEIFLTPPVTVGGDCVDTNNMVFPGAPEYCDTVDNDCDDIVDEEDAIDALPWFADADEDGYGNLHNMVRACMRPDGYTTDTRDCDDGANDIHPGMNEVCDFVDNDCDNRFYRGGVADLTDDNSEGKILGEGTLAEFGTGVGFLPDLNDDGFDDVFAAAPYDRAQANNGGAVYVFPAEPIAETQSVSTTYADGSHDWVFRVASSRAGSLLGSGVAGGDFNGDGIGDLAVGAPNMKRPNSNQGGVFIFFGPLSGDRTQEEANVILHGDTSGDRLGTSLASADLDGDGMDDLLIGAPGASINGAVSGAMYVVYGAETWASSEQAVSGVATAVLGGPSADDKLGQQVTPLGDLNGDGFADLAAATPDWSTQKYGRVWIAYGTAARFSGAFAPSSTLTGNQTSEQLGTSLANVGDINADGFSDVVLGSTWGRVLIMYGSNLPIASGPAREHASVVVDGGGSERFGENVSAAGDMNHDGVMDVLISAHGNDENGNNAGGIYVLFGAPDLPGQFSSSNFESQGQLADGGTFPTLSYLNRSRDERLYAERGGLPFVEGGRLRGVEAESQTGRYVAGGRDLNGDGYSDILIGSPRANGRTGELRFVFGGAYGLDRELEGSTIQWNQPLVVDGDSSDWNDDVSFMTSAGGSSSQAISWDDDNVYLGSHIVDVRTGGSSHFFMTYLGDGDGTGSTTGVALSGQTPTLPFAADLAISWRADGVGQVFTWSGAAWAAQPFITAGVTAVEVNANEVVEISVPLSLLPDDGTLQVASSWLFTGAGSEASYAAVPDDAFSNGAFDPDFGSYYQFDLAAADAPTGYGTNGSYPTALGETMVTWIWDRDLDQHGDEDLTTVTDCPMHIPQKLSAPADLTNNLGAVYAVDPEILAAARTLPGGPSSYPDVGGPTDDCDDYDWDIYFGAEEVPDDGKDNDCDGYDTANRLPAGRVIIQRDSCEVDLDVVGGNPGYSDISKVREGDTAIAVLTLRDPDRGSIDETPIDVYYEWYVNGSQVYYEDGVSITDFGYWQKGDLLEVWIYLDDQRGEISGPFVGTTIIRNSRPIASSCVIDPSTPFDADSLTAFPFGSDPDDDEILWSYRWFRNGTRLSTVAGRTVGAGNTRAGDQFWVECSPTDNEDPGLMLQSDPVTVQADEGGDTGASGSCPAPDAYEENDSFFAAPDVTSAAYLPDLNLCGPDDDYFAILVPGNNTVVVDLAFVHADGDIDVRLFDDGFNQVDSSTSTSNSEQVSWTNDGFITPLMTQGGPITRPATLGGDARWVYVQAYHFSDNTPAGTPYTMSISFQDGSDTSDSASFCADDMFEENDNVFDAFNLTWDERSYVSGTTCSDDQDFYAVYVDYGEALYVTGHAWVFGGSYAPMLFGQVDGDGNYVEFGDEIGDGYWQLTILGQGDYVYFRAGVDLDWAGASEGDYEFDLYWESVDTADPGFFCDDPLENNDTEWDAYYTSNSFFMDEIKLCPGEDDWYFTFVDEGEEVSVDICPRRYEVEGDLLVEVYANVDGLVMLYSRDDFPNGGCESFTLTDYDGSSMDYYFRVVFVDGDGPPLGFDYSIDINSGGSGADTGDSGDSGAGGGCPMDYLESNDSSTQATYTSLPTTYSSLSACTTDSDWFYFFLPAGESVDIQATFSHAEADIDMIVYIDVGSLVEVGAATGTSDNEWMMLTNNGPGDWNYYVEVYVSEDYGLPGNGYDFSITSTGGDTGDTAGTCPDDGYEQNDHLGEAAFASTTDAFLGLEACLGDEDWFYVQPAPGFAVDVDLSHINDIARYDLDLTVYDQFGSYYDGSFSYLGPEHVRIPASGASPTWYVRVLAQDILFRSLVQSEPYNLVFSEINVNDSGDTYDSGAGCSPWSHTLDIDGCDADWYMEEGFYTSTGGEGMVNVTWDADYVYVGVRHPDIASGGRRTWVVAYFDNQSGGGHSTGYEINNQQPTLPFNAQWAVRWRADGAYDELAEASFLPDDTPFWSGTTNYLMDGTDGSEVAESNVFGVVEMKIPRWKLGLGDRFGLAVNLVFEGSGVQNFFESSYSVMPDNSFLEGSLDPDYGSYFEFDMNACNVSATYYDSYIGPVRAAE